MMKTLLFIDDHSSILQMLKRRFEKLDYRVFTTPSIPEADAILAKEFDTLSVKERDHCIQDMHGIATLPPEEPEFVTQKLQELHDALIQKHPKEAYDRAEYMSPEYVNDRLFQRTGYCKHNGRSDI